MKTPRTSIVNVVLDSSSKPLNETHDFHASNVVIIEKCLLCLLEGKHGSVNNEIASLSPGTG